jgi:hypothetical protein
MGATAPDSVGRLVDLSACNAQADRFDRDRKVFQSSDYKEEQLRAELFETLRQACAAEAAMLSKRYI